MDTLTVLIAGLAFIEAGNRWGSSPVATTTIKSMVFELALSIIGVVLFLVALINAL